EPRAPATAPAALQQRRGRADRGLRRGHERLWEGLILVDSSGLFAALVPDQPQHDSSRTSLLAEDPPLVLSPFVLAEVDYLLGRRGSPKRELELLDEVVRGAYWLVPFLAEDVTAARNVIETYEDLAVGLADASLVVLAGRFGTDRILTLDERH